MSTPTPSSTSTVPLLLTTRTPYPVPPTRYLLPTSFTRFQLSQLINTSLSLSPPVPFDFLVRGALLHGQTTLQQWMAAHGVGAEETLEVEYVQSVLPPRLEAEIAQDDWVSAVSLSLPGYILSGAYDGTVRVYTEGQQQLHTIASHSAPITAVCAFPSPPSSTLSGHLLASSSHDRTVHLHHLPPPSLSLSLDQPAAPAHLATLYTSASPAQLASVAPSPSGALLATATWDGLVGLFTTALPASHELPAEEAAFEPDAGRRKRRKVGGANGAGAEEAHRKAPLLVLRGHTGKVSRAVFGTAAAGAGDRDVYSAGWDSTVRQWDVESGRQGVVKTTPDRVHLTLAHMSGPSPLLATGTSDRTVSLFDMRASSSASSTVQLSLAHPGPVPALAPHPSAAHLLTSTTLAGVLQVWDLRAPREALVRVERTGGKCLAVDWRVRGGEGETGGDGAGEGLWATGGEDRKVQLFRTVMGGGSAGNAVERVDGDVDGKGKGMAMDGER